MSADMSVSVLLNIKDLTILLGGEPLFERLSVSIQGGELVALVGANGCGKSTLAGLIATCGAGESGAGAWGSFAHSGSIHIKPGTTVAYLPQVLTGAEAICAGPSGSGESEYRRVCREFGLNLSDRPADNLSGGELQKRALAGVLAGDSDLYIFDEPTNYLDLAGITAFEYYVGRLKQRGKGIVLITHDRMLTDNLADRSVLLTRHGVYSTEGGASAVKMLADGLYESRRARAKEISKKIEQLQADARAKAGWAAKSEKRKTGAGSSKPYFAKLSKKMAKRAKGVEKRVDREVERLEQTKPYVPKKLGLSFPAYEVRNRNVSQLFGVSFGYAGKAIGGHDMDTRLLLADINISVSTRDKLCLMGENGSGKTTLLRLIQKQMEPVSGRVTLNSAVKMGCVPQGLEGFFTEGSLLDNFSECGLAESVVRQYLGSVLIRKDKVHEPISSFSRGELMRAAVTRCVLEQVEFLLLDEPTSHLDIESIEVLEKLLDEFSGGFLVVSHDRTFAANVCDRLFMLEGGRLCPV